MSIEDDKHGAAVKFPPPLIFILLLMIGYGIQNLWPVGIGSSPGLKYLGVGVVILGFAIVILVNQSFKRAETNIEPWKPTTKIVSNGIYAYSRNPVYAGFCLIAAGTGISLNSFWILISFIPSAILVYYLAIRNEEAYLQEKFGKEYLLYKSRVRRWL